MLNNFQILFFLYKLSDKAAQPGIKKSLKLAPHNRFTFYGGSKKGYGDYPYFDNQKAAFDVEETFKIDWIVKMLISKNIIWFKRDLRLVDHAPLIAAAKNGPVLPLYIVEPNLWKLPDSSNRHWHFIYDSLRDLQSDLATLGTPLVIRIGETIEVLEQLTHEIGLFTLWSHEETGNFWTYKRDIAVAQWCKTRSISWHELPSNGIVRCLKNRDGWAKLRDSRMVEPIVKSALSINALSQIDSHQLPSKHHPMFASTNIKSGQVGGRKEALKTLESFGTLSMREVEQATKSKIKSLSNNNDPDALFFKRNLSAFLSRLAWHCHFIQKLEQQPEIEFKCMHPAFEGMREPYFREDFFQAWKTGNTGYPLVDACMRSLVENGWITFRMRAMLVSFASYHLWLDWRKTAPFLAQLFTDYEPGIHYAQFQMQSGVTGINAVRMYNPIKQSLDHDPQGKFIRRYVPELKSVRDCFIHEPWRMDPVQKDYPQRIVDHEAAIKQARAEISKRWKQEGFKVESINLHQKLGSRNRPQKPKKPEKKKEQKQLSFNI